MKKSNLFFVLLTALIVMSCSKDETTMSIPQEGNAIEFGTYVGRDAQTRASIIDAGTLATQGFGVFAFYSNESGNYYTNTTPPSNFTPNFMWNTKVSTASWTYSPIKYWPNETTDKLTFFAYAPYSDGTQNNISNFTTNAAVGDPTLKFTVNGTTKDQSDLLYADAASLKNLGKQTIGGKVLFPFKHALSRIGFKVEVMSDVVNHDPTTGEADTTGEGTVTSKDIDEATTVSVQKVELIGKFVKSSTFNFAAGSWTTPTDFTSATPAYSLDYNATPASSNFLNTVAEKVTTSPAVLNTADSYLMIIPKEFTTDPADALQIKVTYTVTTADLALSGEKSEIINVITSDPFAFTFEAGKAYSFNLHLGLTSVKFSATVADWITDENPETEIVVNVPINTAP